MWLIVSLAVDLVSPVYGPINGSSSFRAAAELPSLIEDPDLVPVSLHQVFSLCCVCVVQNRNKLLVL